MTTFFRLLKDSDKGKALEQLVRAYRSGSSDEERTFRLSPEKFRKVPNTPFAYWVDDSIRELFVKLPPFESEGRSVKQGLATADDFRFARAWWEVDAERRLDPGIGGAPDWRDDLPAFQEWCRARTRQGKYWVPFAKGGEYSPYYSDIHLVVNWRDEGEEIKSFCNPTTGKQYSRPQNVDYYFRPGVTWPGSTIKGLNARMLAPGCIFSHKGMVAFPSENDPDEIAAINARMNSAIIENAVYIQNGSRAWEVGLVKAVPFCALSSSDEREVRRMVICAIDAITAVLSIDETTILFARNSADKFVAQSAVAEMTHAIAKASERIETILLRGYEIKRTIPEVLGPGSGKDLEHAAGSTESGGRSRLSYIVGAVFGRFDFRRTPNEKAEYRFNSCDLLPIVQPSALIGPDGLPATSDNIVSEEWLRAHPDAMSLPPPDSIAHPAIANSEYPIPIPWDGILVDDPDQPNDIVGRLRLVFGVLHGDQAEAVEHELVDGLKVSDLRSYLSNPTDFFDLHLKTYSKSRRKAPIYWPLSTKSGGYTVWIYYPRLTDETLFTVYQIVQKKAEVLMLELSELAAIERTRAQQRRFDEVSRDVAEVRDFGTEILRIANLPYRPDHDDGVPICAAPLYGLLRHGGWSKYLEGIWKKLEQGDFDWAHLALVIWPDRVNKKAKSDRSIALAHRLEAQT